MLDAIQRNRMERRLTLLFAAAALVTIFVIQLIAGALHSTSTQPIYEPVSSETAQ